VRQLQRRVWRYAILVQRSEEAVDLPDGDLQGCFIVAGKWIGHGLSTEIISIR